MLSIPVDLCCGVAVVVKTREDLYHPGMQLAEVRGCGKPASWRHPNYRVPICDDHKDVMETIIPDGWERIYTN